jgi:lipopolysaccharide biosynthesis protein
MIARPGQPLELRKRHDTAVVLHLYYPELWDDIRAHLACLDNEFDLFVTIPDDVDVSETTIALSFPDAWTCRCPNRGRDIAPFLRVFSALSLLGYR